MRVFNKVRKLANADHDGERRNALTASVNSLFAA